MKTVFCLLWEESERNWGTRPDGYSLHLSEEDITSYQTSHTKTLREMFGDEPPDEYDRPASKPFKVQVTEKLYKKIKGTGVRFYGSWPQKGQRSKDGIRG